MSRCSSGSATRSRSTRALTSTSSASISDPVRQAARAARPGDRHRWRRRGLDPVCKCFRAGEHGPHHASEFTMVEWYRAYADLDAIVRDTEELVAEVVTAVAGAPVARVPRRSSELSDAANESLEESSPSAEP